jgi:hypothetical protein
MRYAGRAALVLVILAAGCASPEATRVRGGGPGADPGNRGATVRMHQGAEPYYATPRLTPGAAYSMAPAGRAKAAEGAVLP